MKKYLVTGAAGFVGSVLAAELLSRGHEVWTIDNLSTGFIGNVPEGCRLVEGHCQDDVTIKKLGRTKFDAILHFAGQSSGEISFDDPVYDLRTNTESTLRLIQYGLENDCPRLIYSSSMSVYGHVSDKPVTEMQTPQPLSFYGVGKLASENYLRIYASKGLQYSALRFFNIYGPGQNMQNLRQGMVSIFLEQLLNRDQIIVKGSLDRYRDFIYIGDCVDITLRIIDDPTTYGEIYNIGAGVRTTVAELLNKLITISGTDKEIVIDTGTPGDQNGIYGDISKIAAHTGFKPVHTLSEGLQKMIQWAVQRGKESR